VMLALGMAGGLGWSNDSNHKMLPAQTYTNAWASKQYHQDLSSRYANRMDQFTISREIVINRSIAEVFSAVTTSQLWRICYPETVAVGGITHRPFKKGDLLLEKFLFAGMLYTQFRYEVDEYKPPTRATFHGDVIIMNSAMEKLFGSELGNVAGTFEYDLTEISPNVTHWKRQVHFYHFVDSWGTKMAFKAFMNTIQLSQERGATLFVECVKEFMHLPDYRLELYGVFKGM